MYRGFKQVIDWITDDPFSHLNLTLCLSAFDPFVQDCPSGVVREDTFKSIYQQFFPRGSDVSSYAHFVFSTFDNEQTGAITFTVRKPGAGFFVDTTKTLTKSNAFRSGFRAWTERFGARNSSRKVTLDFFTVRSQQTRLSDSRRHRSNDRGRVRHARIRSRHVR
jgi:hypothetical protein